MIVTIGKQVTLDLSTLRKLIPDSTASRECWIDAIEEACKQFPQNIPAEFMTRLGAIPKVVDYFSHSLDIPDGDSELIMSPGMWIELPERGVDKELLYCGLIRGKFQMSHWVLAEVTFDGIHRSRRPEKLEVNIVNLGELLARTSFAPKDIIDNLVSFWSTVESRIQDMHSEVRSKIACLEFPWLLGELEQIPAE